MKNLILILGFLIIGNSYAETVVWECRTYTRALLNKNNVLEQDPVKEWFTTTYLLKDSEKAFGEGEAAGNNTKGFDGGSPVVWNKIGDSVRIIEIDQLYAHILLINTKTGFATYTRFIHSWNISSLNSGTCKRIPG